MGREDYARAYRAGKKDYQARMLRGEKPTLAVLDDIMPEKGHYHEVPLGTIQVPIERIVGTKTVGRSNSFAGNFMPILRDSSEFAAKWANLSEYQKNEGIQDAIKVYEYMNKFYVEEGNKRVSVMKYFGAVSILGNVIRIVPQRTDEKENRIYFEFLDFYQAAPINYIWFSREGSFAKLQKIVGKEPGEEWSKDELLKFSALYTRFGAEYNEEGGSKLAITQGDAFLAFITLYGYDEVDEKTTNELNELIKKSWEEFELLQEQGDIDLKMEPSHEKKPKPLLSMLLPLSGPEVKAAFIYEKTPGTSAWTYAHELGRLYLEQTFPDEVSTVAYENGTEENVEGLIADAIQSGCNLIFTTTPPFVQASVKAAIANPDVKILNCSLNTSHRYIRTYYSRMHEAKFLMGAIAGESGHGGEQSADLYRGLPYFRLHRQYQRLRPGSEDDQSPGQGLSGVVFHEGDGHGEGDAGDGVGLYLGTGYGDSGGGVPVLRHLPCGRRASQEPCHAPVPLGEIL